MTTITKERIELFIKNPLENGLTRGEQMELARIALASLGAEPIGAFHIAEQQVDGTSDYLKDGEWPIDNGIIEVYAAPPVPVVPAALPEDDDEDGHDIDYLEPSEVYALGRTAGWNACRAAMLQSGNFRENKNSSTNNFREIAETSTNYPVIPSEVLSAILKVARVRADFDDFDGDRRGIGDCLDEAEQELIVTINKYASQLAAEPIATNDVREQQTAVPPVPEIQDDVAQAIENLKQKLVECNRYNYCADAVKGVEDACRAAMLQAEPVSNSDELPLDYLQGHKDGLEWAAQQAEANHPQTGDWLYDDPIDLARAIRKGPDMPTVQGGNSPVTPDGWISCSERMPEMGERQCYVLAADFKNNYPPNIPNTQVGVYGDWFNDGNPTWDDGDGEDLYLKEVTHWMPLPEPPQEMK
ncbi:TPA: DUF551 domain-containing protein [Escherichia coli]|nr:DUF551 domain-containing protein [Escherichia coli]